MLWEVYRWEMIFGEIRRSFLKDSGIEYRFWMIGIDLIGEDKVLRGYYS